MKALDPNSKLSQSLYAAVITIGHHESQSGITAATVRALFGLDMATRLRSGTFKLTANGKRAFSLIEAGDDVPEFGRADDIKPEPGCE